MFALNCLWNTKHRAFATISPCRLLSYLRSGNPSWGLTCLVWLLPRKHLPTKQISGWTDALMDFEVFYCFGNPVGARDWMTRGLLPQRQVGVVQSTSPFSKEKRRNMRHTSADVQMNGIWFFPQVIMCSEEQKVGVGPLKGHTGACTGNKHTAVWVTLAPKRQPWRLAPLSKGRDFGGCCVVVTVGDLHFFLM